MLGVVKEVPVAIGVVPALLYNVAMFNGVPEFKACVNGVKVSVCP